MEEQAFVVTISDKDKVIERQNVVISNIQDTIKQKDDEIASLIKKHEDTIKQKDDEIASIIKKHEDTIKQKDDEIASLQLIIQEHEDEIASLQLIIPEHEDTLTKKDDTYISKDVYDREKNMYEEEITKLHGSVQATNDIAKKLGKIIQEKDIEIEKLHISKSSPELCRIEHIAKLSVIRERVAACIPKVDESFVAPSLALSIGREVSAAPTDRGKAGEELIEKLLREHFAHVDRTSARGHRGDFMVNNVLVEVKNYKTIVPTKEIEKFVSDIETTNANAGLMVSLNKGFAVVGDCHAERRCIKTQEVLIVFMNLRIDHTPIDAVSAYVRDVMRLIILYC